MATPGQIVGGEGVSGLGGSVGGVGSGGEPAQEAQARLAGGRVAAVDVVEHLEVCGSAGGPAQDAAGVPVEPAGGEGVEEVHVVDALPVAVEVSV
ncbi:hypothetical protein ACIRL2_45750 [Embleya sp. NPDC127516]|uniref:hypothetical protein n=1 Tax=Embleya sp. NPDC127516 TaxID=3363990 RepID=UPI00382AD386